MAYAVDDLLEHKYYGIGKVLSVEGDHVVIHFKKDGVTPTMSAKQSEMTLSTVKHDPYFDGIKLGAKPRTAAKKVKSTVKKPRATGKYPTRQDAVAGFIKVFPLGFQDPKYLAEDGERYYKVKAHEIWNQTLNEPEFERLIAEANYDEVVQRAKTIEAGVNLLHPQFERAALWRVVQEPQAAHAFSLSLFEFIYGQGPLEGRFGQFAKTLGDLPQPKTSILKWPAMTIFPFLALPTEHLFMKPEATKKAAQRLGLSLNYQPTPNWLTYSCLLQLGERLLSELADLEPQDMIDVQSFIFVTGQNDYPGS